jgi:hypothetical protein
MSDSEVKKELKKGICVLTLVIGLSIAFLSILYVKVDEIKSFDLKSKTNNQIEK